VDTQQNDTALVRSLTTGIARLSDLAWRLQALRAGGQVAGARTVEMSQYTPLMGTVLAATAQLRALEETEAAAAATQVQAESAAATRLVLALTLLSVPLSIVLAVLLTRSLTRPLSALLRATDALAAGDLRASPRVSSRDEIGQLARAFETMRVNLRTTMAALAQERQQTQAIIDASADGVILVDAEHRIIEVNPAATQLTGWPAAEAIGQPWWTICGDRRADEGPGSPLTAVSAAMGGARDVLMRLRGGQERWLAVSCAPIPGDGGTQGGRLVVNLHDISQLKAIDQLKSDFVAMVSHELRAPLTTVGGAVEMLGQLDPSADRDSYHEVLGILGQQTRRLRTVVEEVLQVTRLEAGRLPVRLQPLPLVGFLRALLERVRPEWTGDERLVSMPAAAEVLVWADPAMLEIVFRNLLDNARKYTPAGSPLEVEVREDPAAARMQVRLRDHGAGIPPDQLDRIFERFSRGSRSPSQWTRGYGLGLYIARELLRAHNGAIWVENQPDGACFVLSLCTVAGGDVDERAERGAAG